MDGSVSKKWQQDTHGRPNCRPLFHAKCQNFHDAAAAGTRRFAKNNQRMFFSKKKKSWWNIANAVQLSSSFDCLCNQRWWKFVVRNVTWYGYNYSFAPLQSGGTEGKKNYIDGLYYRIYHFDHQTTHLWLRMDPHHFNIFCTQKENSISNSNFYGWGEEIRSTIYPGMTRNLLKVQVQHCWPTIFLLWEIAESLISLQKSSKAVMKVVSNTIRHIFVGEMKNKSSCGSL